MNSKRVFTLFRFGTFLEIIGRPNGEDELFLNIINGWYSRFEAKEVSWCLYMSVSTF